jgi:DNA-3-methyladenine glycosylase I
MVSWSLRPTASEDKAWVQRVLVERWGSEEMVICGQVVYPADLPGFAAVSGQSMIGLATYRILGPACEVVSLDSLAERQGIGSALLTAVEATARLVGCGRIYLVTTNDNLNALRFYQKRGYVLSALRPGAVAAARSIKPQIPEIGADGIPLRDELELDKKL